MSLGSFLAEALSLDSYLLPAQLHPCLPAWTTLPDSPVCLDLGVTLALYLFVRMSLGMGAGDDHT